MNIKKTLPGNQTSPPKALLFCFESWREHTFLQAMLGISAQNMGFEPVFIVCDGLLSVCEMGISNKQNCNQCTFSNQSTLVELGFRNILSASMYLDPAQSNSIDTMVENSTLNEILNMEIEASKLSDILRYSMRNVTRMESPMLNNNNSSLWQLYAKSAFRMYEVMKGAIAAQSPELVCVVNGSSYAKRIIYEYARQKDIDTISIEYGSLMKTVVAVNQVLRKFEVSREEMDKLDYSAEFIQRVEGHFGERIGIMTDYFKTAGSKFPIPKTGKKIMSLFTTLGWELPPQENVIFSSQIEWITRSIRYAEEHEDVQLIIRIHPSEIKYENNEYIKDVFDYHFHNLPKNVIVIDPHEKVNSYALIEESDLVLINTSTIGIESAMLKRPTLVVGDIYYKGFGFTIDLDKNQNYESLIDNVLEGRVTFRADHENLLKVYYQRIMKEDIPYFEFSGLVRSEMNIHYPGDNPLTIPNDMKLDSDNITEANKLLHAQVEKLAHYLGEKLEKELVISDTGGGLSSTLAAGVVKNLMSYHYGQGNIQLGEALHDMQVAIENHHFPHTLHKDYLNPIALDYSKHFLLRSEVNND